MALLWIHTKRSFFLLVNGVIEVLLMTIKLAALAVILVFSLCIVIDYAALRLSACDCAFSSTDYTAEPVYAWRDIDGRVTAYSVDFALDLGDNTEHFPLILTPRQLQTLREGERPAVRMHGSGGLVLDNWGLTTGKL